MYICKVKKKNRKAAKIYLYHRLVESVRTSKGPQKRVLLNLGILELHKKKWPLLVRRMVEIMHGQQTLIPHDPEIEPLAHKYAQKFIIKHLKNVTTPTQSVFTSVDLNSLVSSMSRTIGGEFVGLSYLRKLDLHTCLAACGLTQRQLEVACLLIIGRMVNPASERRTHMWAQKLSGLDELLDTDFSELSLNTLYSVSDELLKHKETIEEHLREKERDLFSLDEQVILYDLTNTYFEGTCAANSKATFGRSKEKRSDCRLMTLGLVIDSNGFPKKSKIFSGNQSEPETLVKMIETLYQETPVSLKSSPGELSDGKKKKPTVVIDAGLATEDNLKAIKDSYHYICVSRKKMAPPQSDDFIVIKEKKQGKIEAKYTMVNDEVFLYCKSTAKREKEKAIRCRTEERFEAELKKISHGISAKGGIKKYQKVCERVGRARQKYSRIAQFYEITIPEKAGRATGLEWKNVKPEKTDQRFSGGYYLRTDRTDLNEHEIWELYTMLLNLEEAFRVMKSEAGIRPNYHKKEARCESHIFITILAYHIVHSILRTLKDGGIKERWDTVRLLLSSHTRSTNRVRTEENLTIQIRKCGEPEYHQKQIYATLGLNLTPCKPKRLTMKFVGTQNDKSRL